MQGIWQRALRTFSAETYNRFIGSISLIGSIGSNKIERSQLPAFSQTQNQKQIITKARNQKNTKTNTTYKFFTQVEQIGPMKQM